MSREPTLSLLSSTRQDRLLRYAGIGLFAGIAIMYLAPQRFIAELHPYAVFIVAVLGAVVAIVSALVALYSVRCPKCGLRWVRWAIGHRPASDWLNWLYSFSECPACDHRST
jgi:hypothetical protein